MSSTAQPQTAPTEPAFTLIKITPTADGRQCTLSFVNSGDQNGNRIDQQMGRFILSLDQKLQNPQFVQMLTASQQNPQGFIQNVMRQMFAGGMGGGMMPPMGGMMPQGGNPPMGGGFWG
jgi:hypothetical protein